MEQQKAYKYRCYPTDEQKQILARTFGCCRFVYNWALRERTDAYYKHGERLYYDGTSERLTALKKQEAFVWLNEVSSVPLQQSLRHLDKAKKKKGSKNRVKARLKVARLHARIADRRRDYQHKLSTQIIRENQVVCIESLQVKNMLKNHRLAKAISDVGWGEFVRQLEYKAAWYGRSLVKIDKFYPSSKRCFACGHILDSLSLDIRYWTCPECGVQHDRDLNAARNILAAGLAAADCGEAIRPGRAKARAGKSR